MPRAPVAVSGSRPGQRRPEAGGHQASRPDRTEDRRVRACARNTSDPRRAVSRRRPSGLSHPRRSCRRADSDRMNKRIVAYGLAGLAGLAVFATVSWPLVSSEGHHAGGSDVASLTLPDMTRGQDDGRALREAHCAACRGANAPAPIRPSNRDHAKSGCLDTLPQLFHDHEKIRAQVCGEASDGADHVPCAHDHRNRCVCRNGASGSRRQ